MQDLNDFLKNQKLILDLEFKFKIISKDFLDVNIVNINEEDLRDDERDLKFTIFSYLLDNLLSFNCEIEIIRKDDYFYG